MEIPRPTPLLTEPTPLATPVPPERPAPKSHASLERLLSGSNPAHHPMQESFHSQLSYSSSLSSASRHSAGKGGVSVGCHARANGWAHAHHSLRAKERKKGREIQNAPQKSDGLLLAKSLEELEASRQYFKVARNSLYAIPPLNFDPGRSSEKLV